jgi:hypothetical protein
MERLKIFLAVTNFAREMLREMWAHTERRGWDDSQWQRVFEDELRRHIERKRYVQAAVEV